MLVNCQWIAKMWNLINSVALYVDSEYFRESIRHEIRMARERFSGKDLSEELGRIQKRLDSVELLTPDIIINLLLSYRDIQVCVHLCNACLAILKCPPLEMNRIPGSV